MTPARAGPGVRVGVTRGVGVTVGKREASEFVPLVVWVVIIVARAPGRDDLARLVGSAWLSSAPKLLSVLGVGDGVGVGSRVLSLLAAGIQALIAKAKSRSHNKA
jgi:hypothetical protein